MQSKKSWETTLEGVRRGDSKVRMEGLKRDGNHLLVFKKRAEKKS
jgi:hypothetical protein